MLRFSRTYFLLTVVLFLIEVLIALYVHDAIVRPYVGDVLVVILVYCFVRTFLNTPVFKTIVGVLIFAFLVELSQYLNLVKHLGLQDSHFANVVMGNSFEWIDLIAYTLGAVLTLLAEYVAEKSRVRRVIRNIEQ